MRALLIFIDFPSKVYKNVIKNNMKKINFLLFVFCLFVVVLMLFVCLFLYSFHRFHFIEQKNSEEINKILYINLSIFQCPSMCMLVSFRGATIYVFTFKFVPKNRPQEGLHLIIFEFTNWLELGTTLNTTNLLYSNISIWTNIEIGQYL